MAAVTISATGSDVATALALANHGFTSSAVRAGIPHVVVVFLDEPSDDQTATYNQAAILKDANITIIAVGLTSDVGQNELTRISSQLKYVGYASSYGNVSSQQTALLTALCSISNTTRKIL